MPLVYRPSLYSDFFCLKKRPNKPLDVKRATGNERNKIISFNLSWCPTQQNKQFWTIRSEIYEMSIWLALDLFVFFWGGLKKRRRMRDSSCFYYTFFSSPLLWLGGGHYWENARELKRKNEIFDEFIWSIFLLGHWVSRQNSN